jgi:Pathogenicity locus
MPKKTMPKNELPTLMNVGPATYKDLEILGISSIQQLSKADPDELYTRLQKLTGQRHDPCVWDVFAAIVHEAKTGKKTPWWQWTGFGKGKIRNGKPRFISISY